jgi:hypothetical protein
MRPATTPLKQLAILLALGLATAACTESASVSFNFTSSTVPTNVLSVVNVEGPVRLVSGPPGTAIEGTVRVLASGFKESRDAENAARQVVVSEIGQADNLSLEVRIPIEYNRFRFTTSLDLRVPEDVFVTVRTDNGRVTIERLAVDLVETSRADVAMVFTAGDAVVRTSDAPVVIESHEGSVDVRTSNAPVELISIFGDARALTTNGFVSARVTPFADGELLLSTTNADVDLIIPRDFGAQVLAVTSDTGVVAVQNLPFRPTASPPWQAEGIIGNGLGLIDIRTTIGDIVIEGR